MPRYRVTAADPGAVSTDDLVVKSVRWVRATTAGHELIIQDPIDDEILFDAVASGSNYEEESITQRLWNNGFKVVTMGSGIVYIEYDQLRMTTY